MIQTTTGGGFGGKEEYPSMIAAHAALLAYKAQRPVKIIYDRGEDIAATTETSSGDHPPSHGRDARRPPCRASRSRYRVRRRSIRYAFISGPLAWGDSCARAIQMRQHPRSPPAR